MNRARFEHAISAAGVIPGVQKGLVRNLEPSPERHAMALTMTVDYRHLGGQRILP